MHNLYICIVKFVNTGWQFGQYRLAIWSIPVGDLVNTGWRFGQYLLAIWPYRRRYILRSKSGILKSWGVLELCLDMGSRIKKNRFGYRSVPLNRNQILFVSNRNQLWFVLYMSQLWFSSYISQLWFPSYMSQLRFVLYYYYIV